MPSSKTPQKTIAETVEYISAICEGYITGKTKTAEPIHPEIKDEFALTLRSSMQSLLLHVMGEMPKRDGDMFPGISAVADGEELARARQRGMEYGYDLAITDCLAVIQSTIDSIKE